MFGSIAAGAGILCAVVGFVIPFISGGISVAPGGLGIVLGIIGYALGARRLGAAAIFLCALAMLFGLAASQGLVPGMEPFTPRR